MTTEHLLAGGLTPQGVHRAVVSGDLVRLRPGFYVEGSARALPRGAKHLLNVLAADAALASPVFSHASAALVHGLPEWGLSLSKVAVSSGEQALRTHTTRVMKHHTVSLRGDEVCLVDGLNVTTPERTVADIARTAGRDAGVAVADAALNSGLVTASVLDRALEVDGRSESVAETRSRLTFSDFGLPQPETQANIFDPHGNRVARVDFLWREFGVIGECDGFGKYLDGADATETRRRLGREKDRDAELVALGYRVVHWRWADLENPRLLAERLRRVLYPAAA